MGKILSNRTKRNRQKKQIRNHVQLMFHKISKVFDKGGAGAEGLLLINLGAATNGCRIILDTKEEDLLLPTENSLSHRD